MNAPRAVSAWIPAILTIALWTGAALLLLAAVLVGYAAVTLNAKEQALVENQAQQIAGATAAQIETRLRNGISLAKALASAFAAAGPAALPEERRRFAGTPPA